MKNKKASVGNQIFSFAILIFALFVLITAFVRLTIKYNIKDENGNTRVIGDGQIKLIETYVKGESILFYIDQSAKYSLQQAFNSLAKNGGIQGSNDCGKYQDYTLWNDDKKDCYPEEYKSNFESFFKNYFRIYLMKYPLFDLSQDAYEKNYDFTFNYGSIEVIGKAKNTLEIQLTQEGYEYNMNYEEIDYGFDTTTEKEQQEEAEFEKSISPSNLGSGTCSGNLVSFSGSCSGGCSLRDSVAEHLRAAEQIATEKGLSLVVTSAYRSPEYQEQLWNKYSRNCARVCCPGNDNFAHCPHVNGCAVDIVLYGKNMKDPGNQKKLEEIMCEAGFVRYPAEYWHFEYGTPRWTRGTTKGVCSA